MEVISLNFVLGGVTIVKEGGEENNARLKTIDLQYFDCVTSFIYRHHAFYGPRSLRERLLNRTGVFE